MIQAVQRLLALNASRERLLAYVRAFAASVPAGSMLLDAGAGHAPYQPLFAHTQYQSADFGKVDKYYAPSTYICDLQRIPVRAAAYDAVLFTQVIEHLPEPKLTLGELSRVLRPGGTLFFSGPLYYAEHEIPYDFFRYTQYGLQHLFAETGFAVERLEWLEGYFGTLAYQARLVAEQLPVTPRLLGGGAASYALAPVLLVVRVLSIPLAIVLQMLELRIKITTRGHPKNYIAVLRKL